MTPSNLANGNANIMDIMASDDLKHQVAPVNHTHLQSEVSGLVSELEDKADKVHDHKRLIFTSGNQSAVVKVSKDSSNNVQIELAINDLAELEYERKAVLNWDNMENAQRAFSNPDSVPTESSDNLVTSGGVAVALEGKQDTLTFDATPTAESTNPVTSGGVKAAIDDATKAVFGSMPYYITAAHEKMYVHTRILRNNTGSTIKLTECIDVSSLPAAERANVYWNSPYIDIPNNTAIGIRFVRASNAIYLWYDGNFDY